MLLRKANPPCYIIEQKINTYVQDLYCNNLTSSLPSSSIAICVGIYVQLAVFSTININNGVVLYFKLLL